MGGLRLYFLMAIAVLLSGLAALLPVAWLGAEALESSYREYAVRDMTANVNLFSLSAASALKEGDAGEFSPFSCPGEAGERNPLHPY